MTPRLRATARTAVAATIAGRLLRRAVPDLPETSGPGREAVRYTVDWAGPVDADLPDERAVQAACGLMQVHGRATGAPLPLAVDYASVVAGVLLWLRPDAGAVAFWPAIHRPARGLKP